MNILKRFVSARKLATFLLVAVLLLTLVACGESTGTPFGTIDDTTYLETGDFKVTNKELYNQLRTSATNRLATYIDELVFADVDIDAAGTSFKVEAFEQEINTALFSSASIKPKSISDLPSQHIAQQILSYADSFLITNPGIDRVKLVNFLDEVVDDVIARAVAEDFDAEADFVFGYTDKDAYPTYSDTIDALMKQYKLPVLKKVNAVLLRGDYVDGEFTGELADEDSKVYISEESIVNHYKNNVAGKYDVSALVIHFSSVKEHELARYKYAIKSNSRGEWYRIPNIADQVVIDALKADNYDATSPLGKAKKILTDPVSSSSSAGLGKVLADLEPIDYRSKDFATYYSKYTLSSSVDTPLDDSADNNEVLYTFLAIYDDLNGTNYAPASAADLSGLETGSQGRTDLEESFTRKYKDTNFAANTQLRSYVYGLDKESLYYETLTEPTEDGTTYARPYSRQVQTFNNNPYLVYLLNDERESDDDILDETDPLNIVFADNANAKSKREESIKKLVKEKLNASYITAKSTEKQEDVSISIYDPIIRDFYSNQFEYKGSTGFKNNNVLATVGDTDILVDEFFTKITETLGLSTALDIVLVKKLRGDYNSEITDKKMADFRTQFENQYVNPFLANNYESAGFPATIGLDKFLLLGFGAWAKDGKSATADAIDKIYVQTELRELFEKDLQVHFKGNTEAVNIYTKFAELAKSHRDNEVGISASHLLIYVDFNNDGNPDKPTDKAVKDANFDGINTVAELEVVIAELVELVNTRAKNSKSGLETGLQNVVSSYNNATRYSLTPSDYPQFADDQDILDYIATLTPQEVLDFINNYNSEDVWVPFKRLGLHLKYEALGEINNKKNFPATGENTFDVDFFNYAMEIANYLKDEVTTNNIENPNELLPLFGPDIATGNAAFSIDKARSAFGWHLILTTGYTTSSSAKVEDVSNEDDYTSKVENPFNADNKLSSLNDTDNLTWQQLLIFIEESKEETGVVTLPTNVKTAITKYFNPVLTTYNNSYSQLEIAFNYIFDGNVQLADTTLNAKLQALRTANFNQFFAYSYFEGIDGTGSTIYDRAYNEEYASVYSNWFDVLRAE